MQPTLSELSAGHLVELRPGVRRLIAPNGGPMTGPGTNTYLLGENPVAVIDPGPADSRHTERLMAATGGRIGWLLATHTHPDHSPGVKPLAALTQASVLGIPPPDDGIHDQSFTPTRVLRHDEMLNLGALRLRVVHTPGHASNHLCFLLEQERLLFTGDHIINGSTVVINPPDGDMAAYLRSLAQLRDYPFDQIAPGHGYLIDDPGAAVDRLIHHRLSREAKVKRCLHQIARSTLDELVKTAYDDVPIQVHTLAKRSLLAHLIKLEHEGQACRQGEHWLARSMTGSEPG